MLYDIPIVVVQLVAGLAIWLLWVIASRTVKKAKKRRLHREQILTYRKKHPVRISGTLHPDRVKQLIGSLEQFIQEADLYRPRLIVSGDLTYPAATFTPPFQFARETSDNYGPDPSRWTITNESFITRDGPGIDEIYHTLEARCAFPFDQPVVDFDPPPAPEMPETPSLPEPHYQVVNLLDDTPVDQDDIVLAEAYAPEFRRAAELEKEAGELYHEYVRLVGDAEAAAERVSEHLENETKRAVSTKRNVLETFRAAKLRYERECQEGIGWIRSLHAQYQNNSEHGIEDHFDNILRLLSLPIPPNYPWSIIYDAPARRLEIEQRLPTQAELIVKRSDGMPPTPEETEELASRFIPFVLLRIAQHVAKSDLLNDVESIVVRAWCRYRDVQYEELKNGFIGELRTSKDWIARINFHEMDPLEAFQELGGNVTWARHEITSSAANRQIR